MSSAKEERLKTIRGHLETPTATLQAASSSSTDDPRGLTSSAVSSTDGSSIPLKR